MTETREQELAQALAEFESAEDFQEAVASLLQLSKLVDPEPEQNKPIVKALMSGCESPDDRVFEMSKKLLLGMMDFGYITLGEEETGRMTAIRNRRLESMGFDREALDRLGHAEFVTLRLQARWPEFMDALYDLLGQFEIFAAGRERQGALLNENEARLKLMSEREFAPLPLQRADDETDPDLASLESTLKLAVTQRGGIDLQVHPSHSMRYGLIRYGGDVRKLEDYAFLAAKFKKSVEIRMDRPVELEFPA